MNTAGTMKLEQTKQCVEARDADMSGSKFTDVNLKGAAFKPTNGSWEDLTNRIAAN